MIRCLAIDDEPLALRQLAAYIERIPFLQLVGSCQSALDARQLMEETDVDALFIDINMPDLNGMEFVKSLSVPPLIVFTTAYSEYAVEGYKVDAVDYLLKPFGMDDMLRAANKVKNQYDLQNTAILSEPTDDGELYLKTEHRVVRIETGSIRYIEGMSEYLKIYLDKPLKPITVLLSMKKMEERPLHAHSPLLHHQSEEDTGGEQKPRNHGCRHLPAHRRHVPRCLQRLPRVEIYREMILGV